MYNVHREANAALSRRPPPNWCGSPHPDRSLTSERRVVLRRHRKSHGVELGGALIAASAVTNHAMLWTRNRKQGTLVFD